MPSSAAATVIVASPADHSQIRIPLTQITVTFPEEADFLWGEGAVELQRVGPDGSASTYIGLADMPLPGFDGDGTTATIQLDSPLPAGHYRLVLAANTAESFWFGSGLWDSSEDQVLSDFTVASQGATLDAATDLGVVGGDVTTVSNSLDLAARNDVQLYKLTLASGQEWRLGIQVDAQSIGSGLLPALALFDASGNVIQVRNDGTGRPLAPNDPYLFARLSAGTYYVGVSGAWNLPGQAGGYDPVSGTMGTSGVPQEGGAYRLSLVADAIDAPTAVTGFSLHWADPLDPSPTTLTVAFSGPIDGQSLLSWKPLFAVDGSGRQWPLIPVGYDEGLSQVTFAFDGPTPAGSYTLVDPAGGLTDLVGDVPVATGLPAGVLATWTVGDRPTAPGEDDLGVIWPSQAGGKSGVIHLVPGESRSLRVVVPVGDLYSIIKEVSGGAVQVTRLGQDGAEVDQSTGTKTLAFLEPGVYLLTFRATGDQAATISWSIRGEPLDPDSLVNNGVGQSPALTLRIAGTPFGVLTPESPPAQPAVATSGPALLDPQPFAGGRSSGPDAAAESAGPRVILAARAQEPPRAAFLAGSLPISLDSGLAGRPDALGGPQGVADAQSGRGLVAQAQQAGTLGNRFAYPWDEAAKPGAEPDSEDADPAPAVGQPSAAGPRVAAGEEVVLASQDADALAIRRADRVAELAGSLFRWLLPRSTADDEARGDAGLSAASAGSVSVALSPAGDADGAKDGGLPLGSGRIERAEMVVPIGVLVAAAGVHRLRQLVARWWRRPVARHTPAPHGLPGRPHRKRAGRPRHSASCGRGRAS
ncbi:hypothetical protein OJF2_14710 [Aquisphaera giovannonii]|uniref:Uncharacterized protein n=1 Tax=Aquisphaera giovannonii TaxID=406548 RepID=A0A5B9VXW3_9BACT|nr:hypothetical protein OJF2_14710 [Aquisphaera giovannonii]